LVYFYQEDLWLPLNNPTPFLLKLSQEISICLLFLSILILSKEEISIEFPIKTEGLYLS